MKTIIYSLLLVAFLAPFSGNAQQAEKEKLLGSWVFDYNASFEKMEPTVKAELDTISQERRSRIENVYRGRKITITSDGSYLQQLSNGHQFKGTWVLNSKNQTLEITDTAGRTQEQKITELTSTTLILKPKGISHGQMIVKELHFTKL
jgi:Lipocalin-like domain